MRVIKGSCHCGNIRYEVTWPFEGTEIPARACGCEFCTKHRGTYTSHPRATLKAVIGSEAPISRYTFATGTAEFLVCGRCGVVPFASSEIDGHLYAVVNVNTFDPGMEVTFSVEDTDFDGESTQERLARRKKSWIPTVSIEVR